MEPFEKFVCSTAGDGSLNSLPTHSDWTRMGQDDHFAQFYEADSFLLSSLNGYVRRGLKANEAVVVIATKSHRDKLDAMLEDDGIDVVVSSAAGQYVALDAAETLSKFLVDGKPDAKRFEEVVGTLIRRAGEGRSHVRAFGEMVALLWSDGKYNEALSLEALWNKLQKSHAFSLFCGYPINSLKGEFDYEPLGLVCAEHSRIIPAESYVSLANPDDRMKAVIRLQQQANTLQAEIAERQRVEQSLRAVKEELEIQIKDLRRLHEMSSSLTSTLDMDSVLHEVLRAAMAVQAADQGLLLLADDRGDRLNVAIQFGFDDDFLKKIEQIPMEASACGTAFQKRQRIVIEDVEVDLRTADYRDAAIKAGFRACHSTPLITRGGNIVGVLSVYFKYPRVPSDRETRLLDLYARMAADIIENAALHQRVQDELTHREHLLSREQIARAEAESANRMKDEFLATVSHELRTPLNAIIGWAHMLRSGRLDNPTVLRAAETIERNAKSQAQLVEDILDVSRVITGQLRLNTAAVDLSEVINASIDSVQLAAESKDIQLEVTLAPSARHTIGDAGRLQQVVWNLLSNAIKFTPNGGCVEVRLERAGSNVKISVSDSGQGIEGEFLPLIFDRFSQADGTTTRRHGGLGLGLAIVRHLVELHGGTVNADSEGQGKGSTFTVLLPLAMAPPRTSSQKRVQSRSLKEEAQPQELPKLTNVNVLLIDDDPDSLHVLSVMVCECGATVEAVRSAAEALELLDWYKPTVIVSDIAMPEEDGYSLIAKVRSKDAQNGTLTPAVALTSYVRVEDRARALAAGFNMFVPKPVQPQELLTAIANLIESSSASV